MNIQLISFRIDWFDFLAVIIYKALLHMLLNYLIMAILWDGWGEWVDNFFLTALFNLHLVTSTFISLWGIAFFPAGCSGLGPWIRYVALCQPSRHEIPSCPHMILLPFWNMLIESSWYSCSWRHRPATLLYPEMELPWGAQLQPPGTSFSLLAF